MFNIGAIGEEALGAYSGITPPFSGFSPFDSAARSQYGSLDFSGFVFSPQAQTGVFSDWPQPVAAKRPAQGFSDFEPTLPPLVLMEFDRWQDAQPRKLPTGAWFWEFASPPIIIPVPDGVYRPKHRLKPRRPRPDYSIYNKPSPKPQDWPQEPDEALELPQEPEDGPLLPEPPREPTFIPAALAELIGKLPTLVPASYADLLVRKIPELPPQAFLPVTGRALDQFTPYDGLAHLYAQLQDEHDLAPLIEALEEQEQEAFAALKEAAQAHLQDMHDDVDMEDLAAALDREHEERMRQLQSLSAELRNDAEHIERLLVEAMLYGER